jgi:hypothetical protein
MLFFKNRPFSWRAKCSPIFCPSNSPCIIYPDFMAAKFCQLNRMLFIPHGQKS